MPIILLCSLQRDQLTTFVHNTSPTSFMFDILKHCGVGLTHIGHILNSKQFANIAPSMRFNCIEVAHNLINSDKLTSSSSNMKLAARNQACAMTTDWFTPIKYRTFRP